MKTRSDLEKAYDQLFASFEKLEEYLKSGNPEDAHPSCLNDLNTYTDIAKELGYDTESLLSAFETLQNLHDIPEPKAKSVAVEKIIELLWNFHANLPKLVNAKESHYSHVSKKFNNELIQNKNQELMVSSKSFTYGVSHTLNTYYFLTELMKTNVFSHLPKEVMLLILSHLSNYTLANMTIACQHWNHPLSLFKSTLNLRQAFKEATEAGNIELVKKITEANKEVLVRRVNYTDYTGYTHKNATLLQAAMRAWDTPMKNMLKEQVEKYHGKQEQEKQVSEEKSRWIKDQPAFDFTDIDAAITNSNYDDVWARLNKEENDTPLCIAFRKFREAFLKWVRESPNFTPAHLLKAVNTYSEIQSKWREDAYANLFLRQVIGYVMRFCPAVILQVFAQGDTRIVEDGIIGTIVQKDEPTLRSFKWGGCEGNIIDLADFFSPSGLGHDNFVCICDGTPDYSCRAIIFVVSGWPKKLSDLFQKFEDELMLEEKPVQDAKIPKQPETDEVQLPQTLKARG